MEEKKHLMQTPARVMVALDRINVFDIDNKYWGITKHENEVSYFSYLRKGDSTMVPPCLYITNDAMADFGKWFPTPDMKIADKGNIVYYIYYL